MATLTATAMSRDARAVHAGVNCVTVNYNSGSTSIENSATTVLMCKIPNNAKIIDFVQQHSTGADTCPTDFGVDGDLDALATAATQATWSRATAGVPFQVSLSDSAAAQYSVIKATATPGSAETSLKINLAITYYMSDSDDI